MRDKTASRQPGFTLIELGIVIAIIGILVSLILLASADGVRRAEERQTQSLIIKIETALSERVEALQTTTAPINQTHRYLAAITYTDSAKVLHTIPASVDRRAQVIAQFDYMKAELPDVFYVNLANDGNYPFNFAMPPYPLTATSTDAYALPLGNRSPGLPYTSGTNPTPGFDLLTGYNDVGVATYPGGLLVTQDYGVHGASFAAMGALTKNLYEAAALAMGSPTGINPKQGYDGVDNDKDKNGYIDNIQEVAYPNGDLAGFLTQVNALLGNHDHKTARAEMLYALLVEGQGPLGSAFNKSDFTNRDVADTDGDGMPEFIDAWGQPLQFYRWPIYYGAGATVGAGVNLSTGSSDSQQGFQIYSYQNRRQLDPLDPNQLLTSIAWWTATYQGSSTNSYLSPYVFSTSPFLASTETNGPSPQATAFMTYFHILIDPQTSISSKQPINPTSVQLWDRTGTTRRREYYSKFLVLSGGPDKEIGVFRLGKNYQGDIDSSLSPAVNLTTSTITNAQLLNWGESQAAQVEFTGRGGTFFEQVNNANYPVYLSPTSTYLQNNLGLDDISNHALSAPGSGAK